MLFLTIALYNVFAVLGGVTHRENISFWTSPLPLLQTVNHVYHPYSRIVGGQEATPHSFPHQAALYIDGNTFCGGSLINQNWILTAAHCLQGAKEVEVVLGAHNLKEEELSQIRVQSTEFIIHEHWNSSSLENDIAVVNLPATISYTDAIQPVRLPAEDVEVGTTMTPTGWGYTSDIFSALSDVLMMVHVPTITVSDCQIFYGETASLNVLCVSGFDGKGICNGDSGGPLNFNGTIYGITSFGSSFGCEAGLPHGFTRVTSYLDWIQEKTETKLS